jgi:hypothetical protein
MGGRRAFLTGAASRRPAVAALLAAAGNALRSAVSPVPGLSGLPGPGSGAGPRSPLTIDGGELLPRNALEHAYLAASGIRLLPVHDAVASGTARFPAGMGAIPDNAEPDVLSIEIIPWTWSGLGGRPLGALMRAANLDASAVAPDRMAALGLAGRQFGVPFSAVPVAVFYNPALLQAAGVSAPAPGWDLDALVQTCHELRAGRPGGNPPLEGGPTGGRMIWAALVAGHRGAFLDGEGRVPPWDPGVEADLPHGV